jgi:shikimate kinase
MNAIPPHLSNRSIVLVGLMGVGKTTIGRRLAARFNLPFTDADEEVSAAAGCSVEDIFERYGEAAFRSCERRVISRLLDTGPRVLAAGGGAFMEPRTRVKIAMQGISVWLRTDLDVLVERTARRGGRPLLKDGDHRATLKKMMEERYPVYAESDIVVDTGDDPLEVTSKQVAASLDTFLGIDPSTENTPS